MRRLLAGLLISILAYGSSSPAQATIDAVANDAYGTLTTGYSSGATSIIATTGVGAKFPNSPYNIRWWNCTDYSAPHLDPLTEIVRVTARTGDTFTITRAQEGTTANAHNIAGKSYCIAQTLTKKMIDDIRTDIGNAGGSITDVTDAQSHASLNDAISTLCSSSAVKTLRISNTQTVSANITVCPNVTIWIIGSGLISINNTVTLTIQAPLVAPVRKIFDGLGTVAGLTFSRGEWFGCVRDGSTDDTACLQKAIDAITSIGGQLNLGVGTYKITSSLQVGNYVQIEGFGPAATFIRGQLTTSIFKSPNSANSYSLWYFKNFTCDNTTRTTVGGICFNLTNVDNAIFDNVYAQNVETGWLIDAGSGQYSENVTFRKVVALTTTTGLQIKRAENFTGYDLKVNNVTNGIDVNDSTGVTLYNPKVEAFTNGIRLSPTTATANTQLYVPYLKNTPTVGTGITIASGTTDTAIYNPIYTGLTTQLSNSASAGQVLLHDDGYLMGVNGISKSLDVARNLNGSCTFAAATTCAVTFGTAQADTSYKIQLGCGANKTFWWSSKTTGGFTINASSSSSDVCDWWISR